MTSASPTTETGNRGSRRGILALLIGVVLIIAGVVLAALRFSTGSEQSSAMEPTLAISQVVLLDSSAGAPSRGDIVSVDRTGWPGEPVGLHSMLRVAAVAGDVVACCDASGQITVNKVPVGPSTDSMPGGKDFSITVPAGRVFLLGDNRETARDSRFFLAAASGTLPASAIDDKAVAKLYPFAQAGTIGEASALYYLFLCAALVLVGLVVLVGGIRVLRRRRMGAW